LKHQSEELTLTGPWLSLAWLATGLLDGHI